MAAAGSSLQSWTSLLGFLESDVASALESMARRLQELMGDPSHPLVGAGEPNGFGGVSRHGDLDRLLLSEWMLADEEPLEFLRRMAMSELTYLRREYVEPKTSTRLVLLADVGPDQLGAPRLVHLAGLVVLHRRAEAMGVPLALGLLADEPGTFHTGQLPNLFQVWMRARSATRPTADHLRAWLDDLDSGDHGWLFGGESAVHDGSGAEHAIPLRRLSAREAEWDADGSTAVEVDVDRRRLVLPLPEPENAVALLRGHGLRRRSAVAVEWADGPVRFPRFTGHARRLLCRTDRADELLAIPLPSGQQAGPRHRRLHRFPGPVLAAAVVTSRTVALVADGSRVRVIVVGKRLGDLDLLDVDPASLDLDERSIAALVETDLEPLYYSAGRLLVKLAGRWWFIEPPDVVVKAAFATVAASTTVDVPRIAYLASGRIHLLPKPGISTADGRRVFFGALGSSAYETDDGEFTLSADHHPIDNVRVDGDVHVIGVCASPGDGPFLVVRSASERLIRLAGARRSRTLTNASGDVVDVTLHPTAPILAIQRRDGVVEAFGLPDGSPLTVMLPGQG